MSADYGYCPACGWCELEEEERQKERDELKQERDEWKKLSQEWQRRAEQRLKKLNVYVRWLEDCEASYRTADADADKAEQAVRELQKQLDNLKKENQHDH